MGANQSNIGGEGGGQRGREGIMTSYYELLGVDRHATEEEIKKAYRTRALELHPDRNYGDVERTTALFTEVQAAYEVLSDPQERAWYDSHESSILRGDEEASGDHYEHNVKVTTADNILKIISKFHGGINYTDAPSGFYGFLRETFAQLAKEEEVAADWEGIEAVDYPSFGHAADSHADVAKPFYAVWANFATVKTFAWRDKYRLSDAPDRRIRRLMEKENKASREEGIREFNDAVRSLVAFVRKRDPRYQPDTKTDEERERILRDATAAQKARQRAANEAKMNEYVPDWTKARDPQEEDESDEQDVEEQHYECVACRKIFKSDRQFDAHERSKKHQKAVQALRKQMQEDNKNLNLEATSSSYGVTPLSSEGEDDGNLEHLGRDEPPVELAIEAEDSDGGKASNEIVDIVDALHIDHVSQDGGGDEGASAAVSTPHSHSDLDDTYASREEVQSRLARSVSPLDRPLHDSTPDGRSSYPSTPDHSESAATPAQKLGKAAQKRAKRAAQQAATDAAQNQQKCATCNAAFPSKTRLHQHIKDLGHAQPVAKASMGVGKGKKR